MDKARKCGKKPEWISRKVYDIDGNEFEAYVCECIGTDGKNYKCVEDKMLKDFEDFFPITKKRD